MPNTLYLPELREMLATNDVHEMREFCTALHPARTADFMEALTAEESWAILQHAELPTRAEIFSFFEPDKQTAIIEREDRQGVAELMAQLAPDDRVDALNEASPEIVEELLQLMPADDRRDIRRLQAYPEGTAGSVMTTDFARLSETMTVREALEELSRQAERLETIYYLYIVDENGALRGLVSARQLLSSMGKPNTRLGDIMESDLVTVKGMDDHEEVAAKVAKYDLLAIPVVDEQHRMLGIITHDDVIDVVREAATEDAHRIAAVDPLEESYLSAPILTISWKRGIWLTILFFAAFLTAFALERYEARLELWPWLVLFLPLIISSGGNSGNQSATLVITAMTTGDINLGDWLRVVGRELLIGMMLGGFLAAFGLASAWLVTTEIRDLRSALVLPLTLILVVLAGALSGSILPLVFKRIGLDPAMMSNPFVAGIIDILGIVIYMNVAMTLLSRPG